MSRTAIAGVVILLLGIGLLLAFPIPDFARARVIDLAPLAVLGLGFITAVTGLLVRNTALAIPIIAALTVGVAVASFMWSQRAHRIERAELESRIYGWHYGTYTDQLSHRRGREARLLADDGTGAILILREDPRDGTYVLFALREDEKFSCMPMCTIRLDLDGSTKELSVSEQFSTALSTLTIDGAEAASLISRLPNARRLLATLPTADTGPRAFAFRVEAFRWP